MFSVKADKWLLAMALCWGIFAGLPVSNAFEHQALSPEESARILTEKVSSYVSSSNDPTSFDFDLKDTILVVYGGFTEDEIQKNAASFIEIEEHDFIHLDFDSYEYLEIFSNNRDYTASNTIFVFNFDPSIGWVDLDKGPRVKDMPIPEALEQAAIREHNQIYLLYLMNFRRGHDDGMAVELGAPMEDLSDAEHSYRETLFAGECSSAVRFYDDKRFQLNTSAVYSDAAPGSHEQIECLKFQTLIFLRPASVPFRSIAPEQ